MLGERAVAVKKFLTLHYQTAINMRLKYTRPSSKGRSTSLLFIACSNSEEAKQIKDLVNTEFPKAATANNNYFRAEALANNVTSVDALTSAFSHTLRIHSK